MVMWYPRHKKKSPVPVQPNTGSMNMYKQCINHPQIGVLPLIYHIFHQVPPGFPSCSNEAEWAKWQKQLKEWRQSYDEPRARKLETVSTCVYIFLPFTWNLYHPNFVGYDYCHVVHFITSDCFDVISYDVWLFYTILIYVSLFILLYVIAFYCVCGVFFVYFGLNNFTAYDFTLHPYDLLW